MESELDRLRKKVENFPSASMYNRIAELSRQAGDKVGAEQACRRCIKEFPRASQAYVILADMKIAEGNTTEAKQLVATAIEKDPRSYAAHWLSASMADSKERAIHHLRLILAFKPGDAQATKRIVDLGGAVAGASSPAQVSVGPTGTAVPGAITTTSARPAASSSTVGSSSAMAKDLRRSLDAPIPMPPITGTASGGAAASTATSPAAVSINTAIRQATAVKAGILDALCSEAGVRGAVITDQLGRVVAARGLAAGQDELLAALAADLGKSAQEVLQSATAGATSSWSMSATLGQIISFTRGAMTVAVIAESSVRPAMLELRARQVLVDLGGV